ncbi:hypothetical protein JIN85_01565 [Luteolibacter pohnpeiensis]|uniref:Uncharacterized protein n=1 Tax=Luteolibacter pohnpeiensis TaxID=454153 RepID=A0A934S0N2_9BACT|nr:hypothetical protein [Luteolibacter pohnpeiensis]MBK1881080.1 hypothetical protein [Luteolibacter pohnpeiensis]
MRYACRPQRSTRHRLAREKGFALMVVLMMMSLLIVLGVGLLSLSTISVRSDGAARAQQRAQANARFSLMMAMGELQNLLGPDQRICANASAMFPAAKQPNLLGVWESWRWNPETESSPDYGAKSKLFKGWLASVDSVEDELNLELPQGDLTNQTWLVRPDLTAGTTGLAAARVPIEKDGKINGSYAWAVIDESQKAPINLPDTEATTDGEKVARRISPERAYPEGIISNLNPDQIGDPLKLVTLQTAALAAANQGKLLQTHETDLTPYSVGLLTDVVSGGFKTDLTQLFESDSDLTSVFGRETPYFQPENGAPTWDYLRNHYQLYRRTNQSAVGTPEITLTKNDLTPSTVGLITAPSQERLLPIISKLQIMFSMVAHNARIQDRVNVYNSKPTRPYPKGNAQYVVPMLTYDPVVTLYNPYDVALELDNLRVRISDPPILFGFQKNGVWLRNEFSATPLGSGFQHLARFQIATQDTPTARRYFTLILGGGTADQFGGSIRLEPGELKVFSPRVESNWTWGFETDAGDHYNGRTFFDWDAGKKFGNEDGRGGAKAAYGVESVPGWDPRAGFQVDHLSYGGGKRPAGTLYSWEADNFRNDGWIGVWVEDTVSAYATAGKATSARGQPDFTVDLLAGETVDPKSDYLRSYQFRFQNIASEINGDLSNTVVQRDFRAGDLLQAERDTSPGGKSPFALLTVSAKTTVDNASSIPWLHNNPVVEGAAQDSSAVGNALDVYDVRVEQTSDFTSFPGISISPEGNRGYFGASTTANRGATNVPMHRVPVLPAASLGDLIPANLVSSQLPPRVMHPLGNSRAQPLIPSDGIKAVIEAAQDNVNSTTQKTTILDHSYLLNDAMWDHFFFSTMTDYTSGLLKSETRADLMSDFFAGSGQLLNQRLTPMIQGESSMDELVNKLDAESDQDLSKSIGANLGIAGPFNVNSVSKDAWFAFLSSLKNQKVLGWRNAELGSDNVTSYPRMSLSIAGDGEGKEASLDVEGQRRWAGFRSLSDEQLQRLSEEIVKQIELRGREDKAPFLSLGEFVNRRMGSAEGLHVAKGLLETAIENSEINRDFQAKDSVSITNNSVHSTTDLNGIRFPEAREGYSAEGAPSIVTQGDLLMALAPVVTVRGDTFRIRGYGEAKDTHGNIIASARCEAVVQRMPQFVERTDLPDQSVDDLKSEINKRFGRQFVLVSFRWLASDET